MKKGRTLRFMVVFLSGFLATTTSVYAAHFAAAGVKSHVTDETLVQFWFLRVASPTPDPSVFIPVIPTQFECTVVHKGPSMSFRLFASVKEIESFEVVTSEMGGIDIDTITMKGTLRSHIAFVSRQGVRLLTEEADFKVIGVDVDIPGAGKDTFDLKFRYSMKGIGALLREAIPALVTCDDAKDTCTLELAGTVEEGEIEGHTTGGD